MAGYSIGEALALTGLPPSTLRHWETVVPLLAPRKDAFGRRVYSEADLRLILRLKHLAFDRGLGIGGASEALLAEATARDPEGAEIASRLAEIRGELIGLYFENRQAGRDLGPEAPRGGQNRNN